MNGPLRPKHDQTPRPDSQERDTICTDIALHESEELFRVVFNSSCDAILLHTPEGRVFHANYTFCSMYGARMEEVADITIERISSPSMSMDRARELWSQVVSGAAQTFEWKARRLDNGSEFDVEVFLHRIQLHGQNAIVAHIRDLTVRKQAELTLREQGHLAKLRADAIHTLQQRFAPNELLRTLAALLVKGFNAAFARIWMLNQTGEMLELKASAGLYTHVNGAHSHVPVGQLKIGRIAQQRRALVTNQVIGDPHISDQDWAREQGLVAFAGMPLISEGNLLGVVAFFARHQLSPAAIETFEAIAGALAQAIGRMLAESALSTAREELARVNAELERKVQERTAKLQETIADLERFSYTLTHDMRAPLRAMQGLGGILVQECAQCAEPARREYVRRIAAAASRMDKLITDALQYGATLQKYFTLEPVDSDALLRGVLESYPDFESHQSNIAIIGRLPVVLGNEAALTQCFSNLLSNAIKFSHPGEPPQVRVWSESRAEFVRLYFEDRGIGIPSRHHEKVWVMFQKLDKSTEGTGIGLALVRKTVERMGGKVGLESTPGQGTRFWIELRPADDRAKGSTAPENGHNSL